jgi:hypothetical protein
MDTQPPVMPEDGHTTRVTSGDDGTSQSAGKELASPEPIWDDEDTRSFYESLPDLRFCAFFTPYSSFFCFTVSTFNDILLANGLTNLSYCPFEVFREALVGRACLGRAF